jgi:hypothetical protein
MDKFYRVKQDNFLWQEGAILKYFKDSGSDGGYKPLEDIWNATDVNGEEYISARIIEDSANAKYFERVYPDTVGGRIYKTKEQLKAVYDKAFKD